MVNIHGAIGCRTGLQRDALATTGGLSAGSSARECQMSTRCCTLADGLTTQHGKYMALAPT